MAMLLASKHFGGTDPLIVIGGDTLFYEDFSLASILQVLEARSRQIASGRSVDCASA
jgi:hypothetical protein